MVFLWLTNFYYHLKVKINRGVISPYFSTYLIELSKYSAPFILAGVIKIVYDLLIYVNFRGIKPPEEIK
ncbi:hypothetical protein J5U23_01594 [Saccharolobus shibatae B12]|uniref:Uncharacterized protein n=1 Tax=Saccharolobus shibatae (strain ATCC 51178 / DSM 5389 / JCM 8931 / NBRC 15437 / B12) TaxID=523848 RepID=A0A8F5GTB3_SACSH|nr:hypothetical protein [Saccharolobus shibatae]QXJ28725.1 hypothetical protein J5U23_01594 [Saccharolobus shibatae B12]